MTKPLKLAEAEWEIMEGVWQARGQVTVRDIHTTLYPRSEKAYTTVQTIMNILVDKGFLMRAKIGLVNFYTPTLTREEASIQETRSFVSRLFKGSFGALAHHLINSGELSQDDLEQIKNMIAEKEHESKKSGDS